LKSDRLQYYFIVALRIMIGWLFLYEGIVKLTIPNWTSARNLKNSTWIFADFFSWIAASPTIMSIVDFMHIGGLLLIGIGLFIGLFTRAACFAGIFLLFLSYIAHPPFIISAFNTPQESHYLFINKDLIGICVLLIIAFYPGVNLLSIDRLFKKWKKCRNDTDNGQLVKSSPFLDRRELLKDLLSLPFLGTFIYVAYKKYKWEKLHAITGASITLTQERLKDLRGELPKGKLGNLEIGRVILGNNMIGGWAHARDLRYASTLFKAYNNEKKIFETLELAEEAGINSFLPTIGQYSFINKYKRITGSNLHTICQIGVRPDDFSRIDQAIDLGATTMYVNGASGDHLAKSDRVDVIGHAVEYIHSKGYLGGIGGHSIQTIMACEKAGLKPDFYMKTMHHDNYKSAHPKEFRVEYEIIDKKLRIHDDRNSYYDNMWDLFPEQTIDFMKTVKVPWIGFKVLAGGAILPEDGFSYAFENGADFICVGMFDFQIVKDVNVAIDVLSTLVNRKRPWYA